MMGRRLVDSAACDDLIMGKWVMMFVEKGTLGVESECKRCFGRKKVTSW